MGKRLRKINTLLMAIVCGLFFGCASTVNTPSSTNGIPDANLGLLATAGAAEKSQGAGLISNVDGKSFSNGWKYKLAPGNHTFTLTPRGTTVQISHELKIEQGKRYDIEADGRIWVRNRAGLDDSKFVGDNISILPYEVLSPTLNGGYISSDRQGELASLAIKKQQQAVKDQESVAKSKAALQQKFLSTKLEPGDRVCYQSTGNFTIEWQSYYGVAKVYAFVEQDTGKKLQIRVSEINFNCRSTGSPPYYSGSLETLKYRGGSFTNNVVTWYEKDAWSYCD